jgi:acetyl-CoA C-acetyltransferase
MGLLCDRFAGIENIDRKMQDEFAMESYLRAIRATRNGDFEFEIEPVAAGGRIVKTDEGLSLFNPEKMVHIRPAFDRENGTITAANASSINDGAAALILANQRGVEQHGLVPLAKISGWGSGAMTPERFPAAPVVAINRALDVAGLKSADIDYWEINEAFAVVSLYAMREFGLTHDNVNVLGGAVALGHPIGASGARILVTLLNVLRLNNAKFGVAALCIGGGEGSAVVIERL